MTINWTVNANEAKFTGTVMYKEIDNDRKPAILKESFPGPCTTARLEVKNGPKLTLAFRGPFPSKSLQSFKSCPRQGATNGSILQRRAARQRQAVQCSAYERKESSQTSRLWRKHKRFCSQKSVNWILAGSHRVRSPALYDLIINVLDLLTPPTHLVVIAE